MRLRAETAADVDAIRALTGAAFAQAEHRGGNEARIVDALREAGALTLSLVAEHEGRIVGHAALSPVALDGGAGGWHGLGPVSVAPAQQRQGIGGALIHGALAALQDRHAAGCVVLGDPAYYARFGFKPTALRYPGAPADHFMALAFGGAAPEATVAYHPAFFVA